MKRLLGLALAADVVALMTVVLGSWTRINGAGLTCPDWPLCNGHLIPAMTGGTLWEWTHRLLAFLVAPLTIALIAAAWQQRRRSTFVGPTAGAIFGLFVLQVILGAETVRLGNSPASVVLHWATAMAFIAALTAMAVFAAAAEDAAPVPGAPFERSSTAVLVTLAVTAGLAFATMCVGAYVSSSGAGLACLSIPGCAGNVVVYTTGQFVQMVHRLAAGVTLASAAAALAVAWARPASARVRAAVATGVVLVCLQILLGLLNVALRLPVDLREAHAVNAALLFLAFFVATIFASIDCAVLTPAPNFAPGGSAR
ncbi:MAG TPA: COX15/CtaA family protein [Candidatus Cybelea sp.]|jgi:heme A synthase|nr:COX15/CtaA family protein [Candidatus Cybelea sp.]